MRTGLSAATRRRLNAEHAADAERQMSERLHEPMPPIPADVCPVQRYGEHLWRERLDGSGPYCLYCLKGRP
jgi:hypothetical protein